MEIGSLSSQKLLTLLGLVSLLVSVFPSQKLYEHGVLVMVI